MTTYKNGERAPIVAKVPYPSHPILKNAFKMPNLLWRLGLGPVFDRLIMILTTTGRKSGLPRHTPLEYHVVNGRPHVVAAWPQSDWYRNLQANPYVMIQTNKVSQSMVARRLTSDKELSDLFDYAESHPTLRRIWEALSIDFSRESFLADKERYHIMTFEPTNEPTPPPLKTDLWWVLPLGLTAVVLIAFLFLKILKGTKPMIVVSSGEKNGNEKKQAQKHKAALHRTILRLEALEMAEDDSDEGMTADIWEQDARLCKRGRIRDGF